MSMNSKMTQEDGIDVKEIWRLLRSYRKSIAIIFAFVLAITIYLTLTTQPVYQAITVAMIKESGADAGSLIFDFRSASSKQRLQNEIEILDSYYFQNLVVQSLIEDGSADELSLFGTRYIRKRYRILDYLEDWLYQAEDTLISPRDMDIDQRVGIIEALRRSSTVSIVREADVLNIAVISSDSSDAIFLANRIATSYQNLDLLGGQGEMHFVLAFLDSQITKYETRLAVTENELMEFQSKNKIYSLDGSAALLMEDLTKYEGVYFTNMAELEVATERVRYLKSQLSRGEKALMEEITNTNNPMIVALRGKIAELEAQKIQQMVDEGWGEQSLQARDFERRILEMKNELTTITESMILSGWSDEDPFAATQEIFNKIVEQEVEVHSARSRAEEYKKLVDRMTERLTALPPQILQYARLERELKLNENLFLTMKQKYEESRISVAGSMGKVHILDPAMVSEKIKPNKRMNLFVGIFLGLGLGGIYAFAREFLDSSIKAVETLERMGLTILGIIPDMLHEKGTLVRKKVHKPSQGGADFRRRLITYEDPKSPVSESYRSLRTNVSYASADKRIKSLLISSPQPGEGKSTTTANLAIAFAQLRKRTLLVDADLRKPVQHKVFDQARGPGLAEYLIGEIEHIDSIIRPTKVENLFLVTAGGLPPNPSELLGSDRMSKLVDQLEQKWEMVLFDSPPIVAVTDASMISGEIDAVAMVVKAGQTEKAAVERAIDTISNVKAPLIGVILNGASQQSLGGKYSYYYSYYSYYQYYYADEQGKKKRRKSSFSKG